MVDPPVNSTEWLLKSGVNPKFIDSIILTHAHADHDAGTFQKILEEGKITIYSTKTIIKSFLRKYSSFSGESIAFLWKLFSFHPVYIGRTFFLHGGEFEIFYSLHSIPTIAFRLRFQGKTFVYSSDHQGDPSLQKNLMEKGIISENRLKQLKDFPWNSDVIYHESGIAPLHTPLSFLCSLPPKHKKRIIVYHITKNDFEKAKDPDLRRAAFGIENTLVFKTEPFKYEEAYRLLDVLKRLDFLMDMPLWKIQQFFCIIQWNQYKKGERIIKEGSIGNKFFILVSGNAHVDTADLLHNKRLGAFEYFGEVALLTNSTRTANIIADSDVLALTIDKPQFVNFIAGTRFEQILKQLIASRSPDTWNLLAESRTFAILSDYQKMWIESLLKEKDFSGAGFVVKEGEPLHGMYLIRNGRVQVKKSGVAVSELERGDIIGMIHKIQKGGKAEFSFFHEKDLSLYFISREDILGFAAKNPGVSMKLVYTFNNRKKFEKK
ncbi:MAG: cyclic nucleotide-binding domain-containing protein [Spirochaetales bacterium]|nr:MAG: cyclic nucleotide-binding domain-containing protein [Spirochaetales bacterium]